MMNNMELIFLTIKLLIHHVLPNKSVLSFSSVTLGRKKKKGKPNLYEVMMN